MDAGNTLRILDHRYFTVTWTEDAWKTVHTTQSRSLGYAGFSADIAPGANCGAVEWTLRFPDEDAWLGYNVVVKVDAA